MTVTADEVIRAARNAFGDAMGEPTLEAFVTRHAQRYARLLRKLTAVRPHPQICRARTFHIINSFSARYCALLLGLHYKQRPIKPEWAEKAAEGFDPWRDCGEPIRVWGKPKSDGSVRALAAFGPLRRGGQRLALDILKAIVPDSPYEYARRGRGRDRAVAWIMGALKRKGGRWLVQADIEKCFSSYVRDRVCELLPLPRAVIDNLILVPQEAVIEVSHQYKDYTTYFTTAVRSGLPQGSLCSPFVSSKLLEHVFQALPALRIVCHVDDILVAARTRTEARAIKDALQTLLASSPAGPLHVICRVFRLGERFDYLGYWIRRVRKGYPGAVRARPSDKSFDKLEAKVRAKLSGIVSIDERRAVAEPILRGWMHSHCLWHRSHAAWDSIEAGILSHVVSETGKPLSLKKALPKLIGSPSAK